jgi:hypothetical protein
MKPASSRMLCGLIAFGESFSILPAFPVEVFGDCGVEQTQNGNADKCDDVINGYWVESHSGHDFPILPVG